MSSTQVRSGPDSSEPPSPKRRRHPGKMKKHDRLVKQNLDLLESGNFSDAEITCGGRVWKVHKVILRSRCVWFEKAFASNWQEAQTGKIHLQEEEPEQIDDLLKFIYSGRYIPNWAPSVDAYIPGLDIQSNVSLWLTADFFLLQDLKAAVYEYLIEWFAATLCYLHTFKLFGSADKLIHSKDVLGKRSFFSEIPTAARKIYKYPASRDLPKLFAVFACGLREHLPQLRDLMASIPEFQRDVSTVLVALNFPWATRKPRRLAAELGVSYTSAERESERSIGTYTKFECCGCRKRKSMSQKLHTQGEPQRDWAVTLDPFSSGVRKWCSDCAFQSMKSRLRNLISACWW